MREIDKVGCSLVRCMGRLGGWHCHYHFHCRNEYTRKDPFKTVDGGWSLG